MALTQAILERGTYRGLTVVVALNLIITAYDGLRDPGFYSPLFGQAATTVLTLCFLWCLYDVTSRGRSRAGARAYVFGAAGLIALHPFVYTPVPGQVDYPPLTNLMIAGVCMGPFAFGPGFGYALAGLYGVVFAGIRVPAVGLVQGIAEAALMALIGVACSAAVGWLDRAARSVEEANRRFWAAREGMARAERHAYERDRWDCLIHDKVLGALLLAARDGGPAADAAAGDLAGDALAVLDADRAAESGAPGAVQEAVRAHADRLGLTLSGTVDGTITEPAVREAVLGAIHEAMTNAARHSGRSALTVTGRAGDEACLVRVVDDGRGFDPAGALPARMGVAQGIVRRMRTVGGSADIHSQQGHGTVVTLRWNRPPRDRGPAVGWDRRVFLPFGIVAVVFLAVYLLIGSRHLAETTSPGPVMVAALIVALLTLMTSLVPGDPRVWVPIGVVAALIPAGMMTTIVDRATDDWRYWFVGLPTMAFAILSGRFSPLAGITGAVLTSVGVVVAQALTGGVAWKPIIGSCLPLLAGAAAVSLCRLALERIAAQVTKVSGESSRLRIARIQLEERRSEAERRTRALGGTVVPMLTRLASGDVLTRADRRKCRDLEASARDQLVGAEVLDEDLAAAIARCRGVGARVEIVGREEVHEDVAAFRRLCLEVLPLAGPGDTVRALWRPDQVGRLATLTLVRSDTVDDQRGGGTIVRTDEDVATQIGAVVRPCAAHVSLDEDAVLVELYRSEGCPPEVGLDPAGESSDHGKQRH